MSFSGDCCINYYDDIKYNKHSSSHINNCLEGVDWNRHVNQPRHSIHTNKNLLFISTLDKFKIFFLYNNWYKNISSNIRYSWAKGITFLQITMILILINHLLVDHYVTWVEKYLTPLWWWPSLIGPNISYFYLSKKWPFINLAFDVIAWHTET